MNMETANDLPSIFQGSDILPVQYTDLFRRGSSSDAERRLLFALLEDGIRCYLRYRDAERNSPQRLEFLEASNWINSEDDDGPFAFVNVCESLGIDPSRLRAGVHKHMGMLEEIRV
jgi:hypothetical protein